MLTPEECATIGAGYCPDCGCGGFRLGPRGGAAQNIECMACRSRFNVTIFGWAVVGAERIGEHQAHLAAARAAYRNPLSPPRNCDHCGALYRGPAVYCSHECALADR